MHAYARSTLLSSFVVGIDVCSIRLSSFVVRIDVVK